MGEAKRALAMHDDSRLILMSYACGACSRARGMTETDLAEFGAKFSNPKIFVSLIECADKVITE
jgi:hypothetical protein